MNKGQSREDVLEDTGSYSWSVTRSQPDKEGSALGYKWEKQEQKEGTKERRSKVGAGSWQAFGTMRALNARLVQSWGGELSSERSSRTRHLGLEAAGSGVIWTHMHLDHLNSSGRGSERGRGWKLTPQAWGSPPSPESKRMFHNHWVETEWNIHKTLKVLYVKMHVFIPNVSVSWILRTLVVRGWVQCPGCL